MIYLSEKDIIKLNVIQIKKYSPKETIGVIDKNALSMAINQPKQYIFGKDLYPDEFSKAAVLLINLVKKRILVWISTGFPHGYVVYLCTSICRTL